MIDLPEKVTAICIEVSGVIVLAILGIVCKFIEDTRKFGLVVHPTRIAEANTKAFYECLNWHLTLCLGSMGVLWGATMSICHVVAMFMFLISGVASKSVMSLHNPDSLSYSDPDSKWGLWIPNACGIACALYVIAMLILRRCL